MFRGIQTIARPASTHHTSPLEPFDSAGGLAEIPELGGPGRTGDGVIQLALGQPHTAQAAERGSRFRIYFFVFRCMTR